MDAQRFRTCCLLLQQRSDQLGDGWSWQQVQGSDEGYLRKTALRSVCVASSTEWEHQQQQSAAEDCSVTGDLDDDDDDDDEDAGGGVCVTGASSSRVFQYEYHIVFSCSYSTPVLYFRAATLEGKNLSLEDVWRSVHPNYRLRLHRSPLDAITLQEHPVLGQPFFMLHPCRTEGFMRPLLQAAENQHRGINYVLAWLSVVGPVVGLDVSLDYCQQHTA